MMLQSNEEEKKRRTIQSRKWSHNRNGWSYQGYQMIAKIYKTKKKMLTGQRKKNFLDSLFKDERRERERDVHIQKIRRNTNTIWSN